MRSTSLEAYRSLENISNKQQIVLRAIKRLGTCCDRQIAEYLHWPINRVTPRRGEILDMGLVEDAGTRKDITNRTVTFWKVAEKQLRLF